MVSRLGIGLQDNDESSHRHCLSLLHVVHGMLSLTLQRSIAFNVPFHLVHIILYKDDIYLTNLTCVSRSKATNMISEGLWREQYQ